MLEGFALANWNHSSISNLLK